MRTTVVRISGKARDVFPAIKSLADRYGELTIGEMAEEQNNIK